MKSPFRNRYRVVSDSFAGYEAQCWRWWFPFWIQVGMINTHRSFEEAEKYIRKQKFVKHVEL